MTLTWEQLAADPAFQAQPYETRDRVARNYFDREMADDEFRALEPETQEAVRGNFVRAKVGPVPLEQSNPGVGEQARDAFAGLKFGTKSSLINQVQTAVDLGSGNVEFPTEQLFPTTKPMSPQARMQQTIDDMEASQRVQRVAGPIQTASRVNETFQSMREKASDEYRQMTPHPEGAARLGEAAGGFAASLPLALTASRVLEMVPGLTPGARTALAYADTSAASAPPGERLEAFAEGTLLGGATAPLAKVGNPVVRRTASGTILAAPAIAADDPVQAAIQFGQGAILAPQETSQSMQRGGGASGQKEGQGQTLLTEPIDLTAKGSPAGVSQGVSTAGEISTLQAKPAPPKPSQNSIPGRASILEPASQMSDEMSTLQATGRQAQVEPIQHTEKVQSGNEPVLTSSDVQRQGRKSKLYDIEQEMTKGQSAIGRAIETGTDSVEAMYRPEVGPVSFYWGKPGTPEKNFHDGFGVSHIIAARYRQGQDGLAAVRKIPEVIAKGKVGEPYGYPGGQRINVTLGDSTAVLSLFKSGNVDTWLLTGWQEKAPGAPKESDNLAAYAPPASGSRPMEGAGAKMNTVAPDANLAKPPGFTSETDPGRSAEGVPPESLRRASPSVETLGSSGVGGTQKTRGSALDPPEGDLSIGQSTPEVKPEGERLVRKDQPFEPFGMDMNLPPEGADAPTGEPNQPTFGRPDLANPGSTEPVRGAIDAMDQARSEQGKPERKAHADAIEEADRRLAESFESEKARLLPMMQRGDSLTSQVDTFMAKRIVDQEMKAALDAGNTESLAKATALASAYRDSRAESGRVLAAGFDEYKTPRERMESFILDAITRPSPKTEAARQKPGANKEALDRQAARESTLRKRKADKMNLDAGKLTDEELADPRVISDLINKASTLRADWGDKLVEYYRNALLSSGITHAVNTASNLGHFITEYGARVPLEATLNTLLGRHMAIQFADLPPLYRAFIPGVMRGVRNGLRAFATEMPVLERDIKGETQPASKLLDSAGPAIAGKKGKVIRAPQRSLMGADEFWKGISGEMEAAATAHAIARREGLSGERMAQRIHELTANMESEAWQRALTRAESLTFQTALGDAGQAMLNLRRKSRVAGMPTLELIMPFITTPINLFKLAMRRSAAGIPGGWAKQFSKTATHEEKTRRLAEGFMAAGLTGVLTWLVQQEDETGLPFITGTAPKQAPAREGAFETTPPLSIRMPGSTEWKSYARIEPAATTIGLTVDMLNNLRDLQAGKDADAVAGRVFGSFLGMVREKTFLEGVASILDALEDERKFARFAINQAAAFVPNIVKTAARSTDDKVREIDTYGKGKQFMESAARRFAYQALPAPKNAPPPRVDAFGRDIEKDRGEKIWWDVVRRNIEIMRSTSVANPADPADRMYLLLYNYAKRNPNESPWPAKMTRDFAIDGERFHLDDQEFYAVQKTAGQLAIDALQKADLNWRNPKQADVQLIHDVLAKTREAARQLAKERAVGTPTIKQQLEKRVQQMRGE